MHQLPIEQQVLLALQSVALTGLCIRLWLAGLHRIYVYFFSYLVLEWLQIPIPLLVPVSSPAYRYVFVATEVLVICCYALVVLELYSAILSALPGIATVSRRYIKVTLGFAIVVSLFPLLVEAPPNKFTGYFFMFERPVITSLVIFVLLIAGFLVYYPIPLNRNVIAYLVGYSLLFLTDATTTFINNLGYHSNRLLGSVHMGVYAGCFSFWLSSLNREGETRTMVLGHQWNRADETRLLAQLEGINDSLLRNARK